MLALNFIKAEYKELKDILISMIKSENFFAKKEALKLLNTLLRVPQLEEATENFISSVVSNIFIIGQS